MYSTNRVCVRVYVDGGRGCGSRSVSESGVGGSLSDVSDGRSADWVVLRWSVEGRGVGDVVVVSGRNAVVVEIASMSIVGCIGFGDGSSRWTVCMVERVLVYMIVRAHARSSILRVE